MTTSDPVPGLSEDALDEALDLLAGTAPTFGPEGLSNHGPMAAEALVQMGQGPQVLQWVSHYRQRLEPGPPPGRPPTPEEWDAALGDATRFADFVALFDRALAERPAGEVLAEWVPRLAPGSVGAAGHGLLRTAHAARALRAADRPGRRHELAEGLAYWAASYEELPGPPLLIGTGTVEGQLGALPDLAVADAGGPITDRVRLVATVADQFEAVVSGLGAPGDPVIGLDAVAVAGAGAYLRNAGAGHAVALVHAITVPMATELLLDGLDPVDRLEVFSYTWQAVAAIHSGFAPRRHPDPDERPAEPPYPEEVVAAAVASGDEHAIKLAEAALRAYRRSGEPALLLAAADAAGRLA